MFFTDKPIKSFEEDTLGRSDFARSLAKSIIRHELQDSLVIGLYGNWGFGKTSIINMALEHINSLSKDDGQKPIIIKFNPWNFSEQNQLIYQFFKHLSYVFSNTNHSPELKNIADKLQTIAKIFQPVSLTQILNYVQKSDPVISEYNQDTLDYLRKEIDDALKILQNKIVIVIDDIDRLNGTEIKQVFQLVKSLADFPNTVYILSFNKDVVLRTLEETLKGCSGADYIEDIIQVPFVVPTIPESKIYKLLHYEIEELLKDEKERFIEDYWKILHNCGLKVFFKDIRNINRYMNVLKFDFELAKSEISIVEFLAITAIQVFEPYIYDEIKNNKELFCYGKILNKPANTEALEKLTRNNFNKIIQKREKLSEEELKYILSWLFPKIDYLCGNSPSEADLMRFKIDPSISDPGNFDTYFKSAILETKISSKKINRLISSIKDFQSFKEELFKLENYEIDDFLTRLVNPEKFSLFSKFINNITIEDKKGIIIGLTNLGDKLYNDQFIDINKINNIILYYINIIESPDDRLSILKQAINSTKDNIYISSLIIYNCVLNRIIINQEHIYELRELIKTKIETYERLYRHENIALILANYKKLGYRGQVNYYVEKIKQNDENFIHFLSTFLTTGERLKGVAIRADSIRILLPLADVSTRLKEISTNISFDKFDEHKKYVISKISTAIKSARLAKLEKTELQ
ncbi:MAG: hypothetical protein A2287_08895 [Candidatus Melainabacteria bacterium RIFOXYA12_FULL_32_12]|nr:MAG: hypothetical protein A2255_02080 [Candidatus Melainabacteria bacterium RIFOXYA2_FULL_32_9]OGI26510.1 MAG: hypothetical protein A2287_08895 [Candidatus Melainabacteria bacterium RIFOXYA12_FULL_32_12]